MIRYFEGGNPPTAAGLFDSSESGRGREIGDRLAWWPAGYPVNPVNMEIILREYHRTGQVVTRVRARELLDVS